MSTYVSLNGKFHPSDQPIFTAENRAFKYGDALFETIKCINEEPVFLEQHLQRLYGAMELLQFEWTDLLLKTVVYEEIKRLLTRNRHKNGARLRLTVFRNEGGLYTPITNKVSVLIESTESPNKYHLNNEGLSLGVCQTITKPIHSLGSVKSANALIYTLAGIEKNKQKVDEIILLNTKGLVCETLSSNLFLVIHNRLVTPPLSEGCLPGIMRQNVLTIAKNIGMEVLETPVGINAFEQAEEVFITNAICGAQWIMGYEQKRYFHKISERINLELNKAVQAI